MMNSVTEGAGRAAVRPRATFVKKADAPLIQGRRAFFYYRDLGMEDATGGRLKATVQKSRDGFVTPTGWHYHECEGQFYYILSGWVELELEDGIHRLEAGDFGYLPGGTPHNELRLSENFEAFEFFIPAKVGTTPCDPPAGAS